MKKKLPDLHTTIVLPAALTRLHRTEFPRIYRFITERSLSWQQIYLLKLFVFGFLCGFLLLSIVLQYLSLRHNLEQAKVLQSERRKVETEVAYWKGIAEKYKGYRDVYYKLATLEYKLGDMTAAKNYMKTTYALDPNFEAGRVLGAKIGF